MLLFVANETDNVIEVRNAQTLESISSFCVDKNEPPGLWAGTTFNGCGVFAERYGNRVCLLDYKGNRTKLLNVGAYPICAVSDKENAFIACADSNSIWTLNKDFEAEFIDTTVDFPFSMAIGGKDICICGLLNGEVITYGKDRFNIKSIVTLKGHPQSVTYFNGAFAVFYNTDFEDGLFYTKGISIRLGKAVGKAVSHNKLLFVITDEKNITILNEKMQIKRVLRLKRVISDFVAFGNAIYVSFMFSDEIVKIDFFGKIIANKKARHENCTLLLF